jgi:hypothetical protein
MIKIKIHGLFDIIKQWKMPPFNYHSLSMCLQIINRINILPLNCQTMPMSSNKKITLHKIIKNLKMIYIYIYIYIYFIQRSLPIF